MNYAPLQMKCRARDCKRNREAGQALGKQSKPLLLPKVRKESSDG